MKTYKYILFLILGFFIVLNSQGQNECQVLKSEISLEYKGECKNGLAHGNGEAFGLDHYKGKFKKGYPDGEGTYNWGTGEVYEGQWKNGLRHGKGEYSYFVNNKDTTIVGKWVKDKFVDTDTGSRAYQITYKNNIGRVTVNSLGPGDRIKIKIMRNGSDLPVSELTLAGDTGTTNTSLQFMGFEHIQYPFSGRITFSAPNDFRTAVYRCEMTFKVFEPGFYEIHIFP